MFLDKLIDYYGMADDESKNFIEGRINKYSADEQDELVKKILAAIPRKFGFPDVNRLAKVFNDNPPKVRIYFWAVCNDCGAEYDYQFMTCPKCFLEGKKSSGYAVRKSEYQPPMKTIRWNMPSLSGSEYSCLNCEHKNNYCKNFGNYTWKCKREEWEYCPCKACCAKAKEQSRNVYEANGNKQGE